MSLLSKIEKKLINDGHKIIIGVDEAGRGPWAGPVIAAAVWLPHNAQGNLFLKEITDSKKINPEKREELFRLIAAEGQYGLGAASPYLIDELNILGATFRAMRIAVQNLVLGLRKKVDCVLVDGNLKIPALLYAQKPIVKGDGSERLIAAASIIAKVTRDRIMFALHQKYPQYGFDSHKGYGTIEHREKLAQFGPCAIHRRSFRPVYGFLKK
ncbi:MAG: ribonuclease HII [Candidatus Doudnabacteria bacterium]